MDDKIDRLRLYVDAIGAFGAKAQLLKLAEECCECAADVFKYLDGKVSALTLAGEVADVLNMAEQTVLLLPAGEVERIREEKLYRIRKIIDTLNKGE